MTQKKYQRGIIHSSEKIKKLIDYRINDITAISNQSVSDILEKAILDGLFPRNKAARNIVFNNLYSDSEENRVKHTLESLFEWNSDDIDLIAKQINFRPLLKYFKRHVVSYQNISDKDIYYQLFLREFGTLVEIIEGCSDSFKDPPAMVKLRAEWARHLYDTACKKSNELSLNLFLEVIIENWLAISNNSITYRCLSYIVSKADFEETAQARNELLEIIEQISTEWEFDY